MRRPSRRRTSRVTGEHRHLSRLDTPARALAAGARAAFSIPGLVLFASMTGFGGLVRESGLDLSIGLMMTSVVWALPSQVVLTGAMATGTSLLAAAMAVTLSAVRLLPMTASIVPTLRGEGTSRRLLYLLSHFVAVTPWVVGMQTMPLLPPRVRAAWFGGLVAMLTVTNSVATGFGYWGASVLPWELAAGLVFLTPLYFLLSLSGAARNLTEVLAFAIGLAATPLAGAIGLGGDLVWGGVVGGTLAFAIGRMARRRR